MARGADGGDDFPGRPSVKQSLELERRIRNELSARTWRRNVAGLIFVVSLVVVIFVIRI